MTRPRQALLRLYLVRHGESQANLDGTLAGQSNSPLTDTGKAEAQALSQSHWMHDIEYWGIYSSDLSRAHETAKLALRLEGDATKSIRLDPRLRERAYGAREGMSRKLSLEEAIAFRASNGMQDLVGPYQTEQDLMNRCTDWLQWLVRETLRDNDTQSDNQSPRHIVAFSHAGFIRGVLLHCIGKETLEQHPASRTADIYRTPKLLIPNTSVNVLDIFVENSDGSFSAELVELNWTDHLSAAESESSRRVD